MNSGKLVAIIVASSIVTGFSVASPMTRKLMAMRWSRCVCDGAAAEALAAGPAAHGKRRLALGAVDAVGLQPAATAASRSLSLTRSSSSPCISVSPSAKQAATASTGYSSIIDGARSAGTVTPLSSDERTRRSATSSPPALRGLRMSMSAAHLLQA